MPSASETSASSNPSTGVLDSKVALVHSRHWRRNLCLSLSLLSIWAIVGLGCGVLFADSLNAHMFMGFPLGFWFAQQGSIITFVLLILVYAISMARLDRRLATELRDLEQGRDAS
jgi:putative solute:sodium symporter small subunit